MSTTAARPEPNLQRKAAIANAGARDHRGRVAIAPIPDFDLDRTIFKTLTSPLARFVIKQRVGRKYDWDAGAAAEIESAYQGATAALALPEIAPELKQFLLEECDFDVEHADGSFFDHLYFCFEYTALHYPEGSPLVMFLHSILGAGTNTFPMPATGIPRLRELLSAEDFKQIEAFPSVLRLFYLPAFRQELAEGVAAGRALAAIELRRVIDNRPLELSGAELWQALNYQLVHLVDFQPVANWAAYQNDTFSILFRDLFALLEKAGKRVARVTYEGPVGNARLEQEKVSFGGWLTTLIPVGLARKLSEKSIRNYSARCGHSLDYRLRWA